MDKKTAIATSAGMVMLAAAASGALIFSAQGRSSAATAQAPAEIVIEYVTADGTTIPIEPVVASLATEDGGLAETNTPQGDPGYAVISNDYEADEYEEEDHDEYEEEDHDEYEEEDHDEYEEEDDD